MSSSTASMRNPVRGRHSWSYDAAVLNEHLAFCKRNALTLAGMADKQWLSTTLQQCHPWIHCVGLKKKRHFIKKRAPCTFCHTQGKENHISPGEKEEIVFLPFFCFFVLPLWSLNKKGIKSRGGGRCTLNGRLTLIKSSHHIYSARVFVCRFSYVSLYFRFHLCVAGCGRCRRCSGQGISVWSWWLIWYLVARRGGLWQRKEMLASWKPQGPKLLQGLKWH